jgi:hypothetical protein
MKIDAANSGIKLVPTKLLNRKDNTFYDVILPKYASDHQLTLYIQYIQKNVNAEKDKELKKMKSSNERRIRKMFLNLEEIIYGQAEHERIKESVRTKRSEAIAVNKAAKALVAGEIVSITQVPQTIASTSLEGIRPERSVASETADSDDESVNLGGAQGSRVSEKLAAPSNGQKTSRSHFLGDRSEDSSDSESDCDDGTPYIPKDIQIGSFGKALLGQFRYFYMLYILNYFFIELF